MRSSLDIYGRPALPHWHGAGNSSAPDVEKVVNANPDQRQYGQVMTTLRAGGEQVPTDVIPGVNKSNK
jgi:hypothetical protein